MTTNAGIYVRISRDRAGGGLGVARQERDCRGKAEQLGWNVAQVYADNDVSAASGKPRLAYQRMLRDVEAGVIDGIVSWHADRLHRRPIELEDFIKLIDRHGVAIATVTAGDMDLSTPSGQMVARMLGATARYEVDQTRARIKRKARELAEAGKIGGGGSRPFGFEADRITVRKSEADLIRDAATKLLAGDSIRSIASDWTNIGVPTTTNGTWTDRLISRLIRDDEGDARQRCVAQLRVQRGMTTRQLRTRWNRLGIPCPYDVGWTSHVVRRLMRSARIAGLREHNGVVVLKDGAPVEAEWPAIIDRVTHERLRRLLDDPARNKRGGTATGRKYLLSGLAECALCGKKLISRPAQRRKDGITERLPSMVCASGPPFHGCGKLRIRAEWLEGIVSGAVVAVLDGPTLNELVRSREDSGREAELQKALDEDRDALAELARDRYERRTITDAEFRAVRPGLLARIERNERALAEAVSRSALVDLPTGEGALAQAWDDWSVDRRRAVIDAAVDNVIVKPGLRGRNRYTPEQLAERVDIVWVDELQVR